MPTAEGIEVRIMGVTYAIKGRSDEKHLREVAAAVDQQMTVLAKKTRLTSSTPRLAVLTALNFAEEVFRLRAALGNRDEARRRLTALEAKIAAALPPAGGAKAGA